MRIALLDEAQQYGNIDELTTLARLPASCLVLWCGDHKQTPGGLRNTSEAKLFRRKLLSRPLGLRCDTDYVQPHYLCDVVARFTIGSVGTMVDIWAGITLPVVLWQHLPTPTPFELVLQNWMKQHGIKTVSTLASKLVCLQVCRFSRMDMVDRRAFSFGTMSFALDVFTDASSLNVASVPYEMIGAVTYSGDSLRGHYQGAIRLGLVDSG